MSEKPSVILLGGLNGASAGICTFLVPEKGEPLVSFLRIVDKYSVAPPTTYLGARFKEMLKNPIVQYQQVNLTVPAGVAKAFDPPEGQQPFKYVIDFTGENRYDRPDAIQIDHTVKLARLVGLEAAKRKVAAYVRISCAFYETSIEKKIASEKAELKPVSVRGKWWHEMLRSLAAIEDLNLVILRFGSVYGPFVNWGLITPRIVLGQVYKFTGEEMKFLWGPGVRINTTHIDDLANAAWELCKWMEPLGREQANKIAGEALYFANDRDKVKAVPELISPTQVPIAPLFNIVDDSDSTQKSIAQVIADVFSIKFGFHNMLAQAFANLNFKEMSEEVNEMHMEQWTKLITTANPPVPNTPLTVYIEKHLLEKFSVAYDGKKIKEVVGYKLLRPRFTKEIIEEVIESFKSEGSWPNLPNNA
jgi:hypothetical protein